MNQLKNIASLASLLALLAACQTVPYQGQARDVKRKPREGGVVAIKQDHRPEDRAKAEEIMKSNCGSLEYKIVDEGEFTTGQEVVSNARETNRASTRHQVGSVFGMAVMGGEEAGKSTESSQVSRNLNEWRITYECEKDAVKASAKGTSKKQ